MSSGGAPTGHIRTLPGHLKVRVEDITRTNARLMVRRPTMPEATVTIERNDFTIGREAKVVDLVLEEDLVSRKHASLRMDERGYFKLEDLGSKNGIGFHGRAVRSLNLVDGDVFTIGSTEFTFRADMARFEGDPSDSEAAPPTDGPNEGTEHPPDLEAPPEAAGQEEEAAPAEFPQEEGLEPPSRPVDPEGE